MRAGGHRPPSAADKRLPAASMPQPALHSLTWRPALAQLCASSRLSPVLHAATSSSTSSSRDRQTALMPSDRSNMCTSAAAAAAALAQPGLSSQRQSSGMPGTATVELIIGPMFAGKSTLLLDRVRKLVNDGRRTALVKSSTDTRYSYDHITTHAGDKLPCTSVELLLPLLRDTAFMGHDVIAIDEAQFFPDLTEFVVAASEHHHRSLLVAGLDGDFRRKRFGGVLDLIPLADSVTKLNGKCHFCDRSSIHSLRVVADERQQLVGGSDKYVPACRMHYLELNNLEARNS